MQRVAYLDGWRGFAVLCVLFAHFISDNYINLGRFGVELFFVLSGRLMAEILFVRNAELPSFFARRFARVYPALLVFSIAMLMTSDLVNGGPTVTQFLASITFTLNYVVPIVGGSPVLDHIWSLCIEEHMYIFLGLVAFVHRRRALPLVPIFIGLAAAGMIVGTAETLRGMDYYQVYWKTHVRGTSLLLGVIAYLTLKDRIPKIMASPWMPLGMAVFGVILHSKIFPDPIKYSLGSLALAISVMLMSKAPKSVLALLEHPLTLRIGLWSYSIYLWQQPFAKLDGGLAHALLHMLLAVLAGVVSFYLVERPARRFLNHIIKARFDPRAAGAPTA